MYPFFSNLKREASENPTVALGAVGAALIGLGQLIGIIGRARGSHAYAKDVNRRIAMSKAGYDKK